MSEEKTNSSNFDALISAFSVKEQPESQIELIGAVPAETIASYRESALSYIAKSLKLPGFRDGHVPPQVALKQVGEMAVLEEAVELFVRDFYPELILGKNIDAAGRPDIRITKLAPGNPVELTIRTAVYPKIELPKNWRELASKVPDEAVVPVEDKDIDETLTSLQKARTKQEEGKEPAVPEINDEFARSLGAFKDLEELKAQIKKGVGEEKVREARDKRRGTIIDAILDKTKVEIPRIFVESELDKIIAQMKEDIARMGLDFADYLTRIGKKEEEVREGFKEQAHKRAKLQLTLNELAKVANVEADKAEVDEEMKHALEHFPDANPELLRIHIETVLRNAKVLELLEQKEETKA